MSVAVAQIQRGGDSLSDYLSRGLHNMLSVRQLRGVCLLCLSSVLYLMYMMMTLMCGGRMYAGM